MKSYKNILYTVIGILVVFTSCEDEPVMFSEGAYVAFDLASSTLSENNAATGIRVYRSSTDVSAPLAVTFSLSSSYTTTTDFFDEGADAIDAINTFGDINVTIEAGEAYATFSVFSIDDDISSGNKVVAISITSAPGYNIGLPGPDANKSSHTLTVIDDDCPLPDNFVGSIPVSTEVGSPGTCGTVSATIDFTLVSENADGTTTYSVSDVTGGHYPTCYSAAVNPGEITISLTTVVMVDQPDVVYGGDVFNGTGIVNSCAGVFTLEWSNGYGDSGISTFAY